jgi:hypothetical protein
MSPSLTEGKHTGEFMLSEARGSRAREKATVTVDAETTFAAGSVLGRITATGKYILYDEAAVDGSETAAGILYDNVPNDGVAPADFTRLQRVVLHRRDRPAPRILLAAVSPARLPRREGPQVKAPGRRPRSRNTPDIRGFACTLLPWVGGDTL